MHAHCFVCSCLTIHQQLRLYGDGATCGFKSHLTDWRSRESNLQSLVFRACGLCTISQRLLTVHIVSNIYVKTHQNETLYRPNILTYFSLSNFVYPCNQAILCITCSINSLFRIDFLAKCSGK